MGIRTTIAGLGGVFLAAAGFAAEKPVVEIGRVPRPPALEDFLGMAPPDDLREAMTRVPGGFIQREPVDGNPASERTDVWIGYDDLHFYAVFVAFDSEPKAVRAHWARREQFFGDDIVHLMLDTFHDERRAYSFICNPYGVQFDAIWTEAPDRESSFDSAFDTVWDSKGALTPQGYVVWMAIPFKSLRFPKTEVQTWGLFLNRDIPRKNEEAFWPIYTNRVQGRLNQAGVVTGLRAISPGRNLQLIPYGAYRRFETLSETEDGTATWDRDRSDFNAGIDLKTVFRDSLVFDFTVKPDFSQVESDEPQITTNQRFEVYFPEKRPFFLENAGYFETPITLLFTRRIGQPRVGGRLTGKTGPWSLGFLAIDDEAPGKTAPEDSDAYGKRAYFGVLRASRDVGRQSTVGGMVVSRSFAGGQNQVGSLDGRITWDENWQSTFQAAFSSTRSEDDDSTGTAYQFQSDRRGRHLSVHLDYQEVSDAFEAQAGFVPRRGYRDLHQNTGWTFRPEGPRLLNWTPSLFTGVITDRDGTRLDRNTIVGTSFEFRHETSLEMEFLAGRERLRPEDADGLVAPVDYSVGSVAVGASSRIVDPVELAAELQVGHGINFDDPVAPSPADFEEAEVGLRLHLGRRVRIDTTWLALRLEDQETGREIVQDQTWRTRFGLELDRRTSLRLIAEYRAVDVDPAFTTLERERRWNVDFLLSYIINPWTAFYFGANSDWQNLAIVDQAGVPRLVRTDRDMILDGKQVFVKLSWLFRP